MNAEIVANEQRPYNIQQPSIFIVVIYFHFFRLSERKEDVSCYQSKAEEMLNNVAFNYLRKHSSENNISASGSLAILQHLASLMTEEESTNSDGGRIHETMKFTRNLMEGKSDLAGNELTILHNIWLGNGLKLNKNVRTLIARYYCCEMNALPIVSNRVNVPKLKKKLQKLDQTGRFIEMFRRAVLSDISPQDILLTSGFYVEVKWREAFKEKLTTKGPFHISESEKIEADLMVQKCGLVCVTCDNISATVLQLPLTARNMSMLVFIPSDKTKDLHDVATNLTPENFEILLTQLKKSKQKPVYVTLPKFTLKQSGVTPSTFSETEDKDLSGRYSTSAPGCKIFHTSSLSVNEYGLNIAKTGQSESTMAGPAVHDGIKWTHFTATLPFLFMMVDMENKLIFLVGNVRRPEQMEKVERRKNKINKSKNLCCP